MSVSVSVPVFMHFIPRRPKRGINTPFLSCCNSKIAEAQKFTRDRSCFSQLWGLEGLKPRHQRCLSALLQDAGLLQVCSHRGERLTCTHYITSFTLCYPNELSIQLLPNCCIARTVALRVKFQLEFGRGMNDRSSHL